MLEASDGANAVTTYLDNAELIDLVVMDLVLPRMGGVEAASKISNRYPNVKIVFTSGYPADSEYTRTAFKTGRMIIPKPYGIKLLRSRIRTALDSETHKGAESG